MNQRHRRESLRILEDYDDEVANVRCCDRWSLIRSGQVKPSIYQTRDTKAVEFPECWTVACENPGESRAMTCCV